MRKLLCLLASIVALLGTVGARADVGPPVHIRILGEPRAAVPGVPFTGQLQITAGTPLVLEDMRFGGASWDQLSLAVSPQVSVDKSRALVVDFSVVTEDPEQWLEFSLVVDGYPVTRQFNLSPAAINRLLKPGAMVSAQPTGNVPPLTDEARAMLPPMEFTPTERTDKAVPDKSRSVRVHGRFVYQRSDGTTVGADGVSIFIYDDNDPFDSGALASLRTDAQGWYDATVTWVPGVFDAEPDLYVTASTVSWQFSVTNPAWDPLPEGGRFPYKWVSATNWNFTGSDLDLGWLQPGDINDHPALHLMTNLTRTWRWWQGYGYDAPYIRCNWPNGEVGAFYNGEMYVSTGEQWNENVISHEYGHHWMETYALSPAPFYCNGICDNDGCGHCLWCPETDNISFTEGFPDWMGDVIPGSYAATYGLAAQSVYDMESLGTCFSSYADPLTTEGFLAAVVRDIGDATNDDHAAFPETDELSLGWSQVIATVDLDHPTSAWSFLAAFRNRYPGYSEALWATAKNCGYELDMSPPPAVTGLYSPSHAVGGDSADPTIDLAWTRAADDVSGIRGYGITIASGIGLPTADLDLGDVTSYTTPTLAPGTYYFSIRTLDRSGKWSGTYAWSGPYTVRAPLSANLAFYQFPGWDFPLVPRSTTDASFGSVPAPAMLTGESAATWCNVGLWNSGESSTASYHELNIFVDGARNLFGWFPELAAFNGQYITNLSPPITVRGGRHTYEARLDATDLVAETNETDNRWAHQWIWNPATLTPNVPVVRAAPPQPTGGWEAVTDGSPLYGNVDGVRMSGTSWWDVAVMRPLSAVNDRDVELFAASAGASTGFATPLAGSYIGGATIDAVIVNHNWTGWGTAFDVGIVNQDGRAEDYEITHVTNGNIAYGDSVTVAFGQDQMLRIWEFFVSAEQVGAVSITVDTDPANGPLHAHWLDASFDVGALPYPTAWGYSDASGRARMDLNIPSQGYHALLVYRDANWDQGNLPINVTIEIDATPPDFVPLYAAGWYAPIVPRAAHDGTNEAVPAPLVLPGNTASTFLNVAVRNESPGMSLAGLPAQVHIDGGFSAWVNWGWFPGYANGMLNWGYPFTFSGGRHTLAWKPDAENAIEEIHEGNNDYTEQWVWSPLALVNNTPVVRGMPADPYGGWAALSTGEPFHPNCDGLRTPPWGGYWQAIATMPTGGGSDVDLRLHHASAGAKSGFADNLTGSYWGGSYSDYVLVNFNLVPGGYQPYDAGVVRYNGVDTYATEATASATSIAYPNDIYGPFSLPEGRILNLVELYLPAGELGIHLMNLSGSVDWGVTLHRADLTYLGKSDALGTSHSGGGPGGNELVVVNVPAEGYYCLAVWKTTSSELAKAGTYNLVIKPMWASGVDDQVPSPQLTGLVDITPNPFNPQTKITYDLARASQVRLEVYDVKGHLVRTLVSGARGSGRHIETWNGIADNGERVSSGVYLARLTADGVTGMMKMMLLK
ncbi:MAG: T9SS type A sorting domain-containing protein [bacterium]|nr:T9SS type A sorting domain-containing protein [bacterium]